MNLSNNARFICYKVTSLRHILYIKVLMSLFIAFVVTIDKAQQKDLPTNS